MVRGGDSEASEGGGCYAARANGIHAAVDLDGFLGEPVFAVADGKVVVAVQSDLGPRLRDSVDGLGASFVRNNAMTEVTGVLHPERAVGFRTCWEDPTPAMKRSAVAMP